ncbi:MAG: tetratricopeptide repeat protein [Flavobacteriales bacterium]|nr:tetratricopeptide repeat protein [Flavobacteriales bacterium]
MKKILLLLLISYTAFTFAQIESDQKIVGEGIALHDQGAYRAAITKYQEALAQNPNNVTAYAEKALSLMMLNEYDEVVKTCQKCIAVAPDSEELKTVYATYANAFDMMGQPKKALSVYDEGLKRFPGFYHLYFNKGITLVQMEAYKKAIQNFEKAIQLNPQHPGSHNALARVLYIQEQKIPALMVLARFFILEPNGKRAKLNIPYMEDLTKGNAQKTGRNSVTINIDVNDIPKEGEEAVKKENDFTTTALVLALNSGMDFTKANKKKTEVDLLKGNIETLCSSLEELKADNHGLYWDYFAPYFIEMNKNNYIETFSYIVYSSSDEKYVKKWIAKHKEKIDAFYSWSNNYSW